MTGVELKAAESDDKGWDDIVTALKTAGLNSTQVLEIMKKVAAWGVAIHKKAGDSLVKSLKGLTWTGQS